MAATLTKTCPCCRAEHLFFLPVGNAAGVTMQFDFICPRTRNPAKLETAKGDPWKSTDSKPPGSVVVRKVLTEA